ncbi:FtsK/SpoIIIE domain-containing protein [Aliarcobacter butzleri]|uniref:FtsK/SpoIIIE domain-containing protein n=1 Tax=Aliarcobacter butzleri TaxID=28197 RepID=UPI00125FEFBE|nr:FtsK/SpoIIIE domain-containing protein [Aliarcobacter butzleri]
MLGAIYRYFIRFIFINLAFVFSVIGFQYYLNSESLSHYSGFKTIFHLKSLFNDYILNSIFFDFYEYLFFAINIYLLIWLIRYFKYLNLPYALNIFKDVKQIEGMQKKYKASHDVFKKKVKTRNGYKLYYKNWVSISLDAYNEKKKEIVQYLNFEGEIDVKPSGKRGVELIFYSLPKVLQASLFDYKKGFINYGFSRIGNYYVPFENLIHTICVGESGSGKSNNMHHLLQSIMLNDEMVEKVELIDLKGTELYRYRDIGYMNFIDDINQIKEKLSYLKEVMNSRFQEMKEKNLQLYNGKFHFVFIDEIGTIGTYPNKKLRDEIFDLMIELFQKGRAARIIFFIFAQKIDSTNIPSNVLANIPTKVLMKTDSDFNINNTIGTKESLERITLVDPDSFNKGRAIIKDGYTSEKILLQIPYVKFKD